MSLVLVLPSAALAGAGCGIRWRRIRRARGRRCSLRARVPRNPCHAFSFNWSRYHSATPCFTRRTKRVVAFMPAMSMGSSVASKGTPAAVSCLSSLSALNVSRPNALDVFAHDGGEPGRRVRRLRRACGEASVARDTDVDLLVGGAVAPVFDVHAAGFDVPEIGGDEPAGRAVPPRPCGAAGASKRGRPACPASTSCPGTPEAPVRRTLP